MTYLLIVFFAWVSLFPEPVQEHYQLFTKLFLGAFFLFLFLKDRNKKIFFKRQDLPLWLFVVCISGGIIFAQDKQIAIKTYLHVSLTLVFLYYLTGRVFSSHANIQRIAKIICIFSTAVAVFAIIEWASGKNFIYEYILYNPFYQRYINLDMVRPMSTQFNPAVLGSFLLGCLPFGFILIKEKSSFFRVLGVLAIILNIGVIMLSGSRGVFLGMVFLFLFYLWIKKRAIVSVLLLGFILIIVAISSWQFNANTFYRFGFKRLIKGSEDSIFSPYRTQRFLMSLSMLKESPFFGIGLKHFRIEFDNYIPDNYHKTVHELKIADNMYLTLLAETGLIGLSGFILFIFYLLRRGLKAFYVSVDSRRRDVLLVAMSALIGLLVNMGGYELFYWHNPFSLFCILCGIIAAESFHKEGHENITRF